jgi:hypothetical protein
MVRRFTILDAEWEARQIIGFVGGRGYPVGLRRVGGTRDDELVGQVSKSDVFEVELGELRNELSRGLEIARYWNHPAVARRGRA